MLLLSQTTLPAQWLSRSCLTVAPGWSCVSGRRVQCLQRPSLLVNCTAVFLEESTSGNPNPFLFISWKRLDWTGCISDCGNENYNFIIVFFILRHELT
jgi:hypothetical protein